MATNSFDEKYKPNIDSLAKANGVDTGVASAMLRSNLAGKTNYQGGGTLDFAQANRDLQASLAAPSPSPRDNDTYKPERADFDTQGMYDTSLKARNALLEQNYNTMMNTLKNNYDNTMAEYNNQNDSIYGNYEDTVKGIHKQTYDSVEANKVLNANRGMMNSEQGMASRQGVVRQGNDNINSATKERNQMLNELATKISNLTKTYGNDVLTAQSNYALGQTQALNESLLAKQQADMNLAIFNTGEANKFGLQQQGFQHEDAMQGRSFQHEELMQGKQFEQDAKMFGLNAALQLQLQRISEAGANSRAAAANALAREQWEWEKGQQTKQEAKEKKQNVFELRMAMLKADPNYDPTAKTTRMDRFLHGENYLSPATKINQEIAKLTAEYGELNDTDFLNKYLSSTSYTQNWYKWSNTPPANDARTQYIHSLNPSAFRN